MPTTRRLVTEALVLRSVDHGESDRVVRLLTPETGRLTAIAKGARRSVRRFPGTLDFFNRLRVQIERPRTLGLARLEHASLVESYGALRVDPARFALGCYLLELLDRLAPEGGARPDVARLFAFARAALETLDRVAPDRRLRVLLELRALDALGLRPELRRCVRCGNEAGAASEVGFHVAEGGPICPRCAASEEGLLRLHLGTLRALERGLSFDLSQLERLSLGAAALVEARELVRRFQRFHLGVELRSEPFLDSVLGGASAPRGAPSAL